MKKTAKEIRSEIARIIRVCANDRFTDGDPEGAGVIRDLAKTVERIRLTK